MIPRKVYCLVYDFYLAKFSKKFAILRMILLVAIEIAYCEIYASKAVY